MRNLFRILRLVLNNIIGLLISPYYGNAKNAFRILCIELNPFSKVRSRPEISRYVQYTRDILRRENFEIGEYTYGSPKIATHTEVKLKIGKFCSIASDVKIHLGGIHRMNLVTTYPFKAFPDKWPREKFLNSEEVIAISKGDVIIGNDVWIGDGATILSGVKIGDGAVVGAMAVVTKDVEPYCIVAGNPARTVGKRFDDDTIRKLLEIRWWDWPIEKIDANLEIICSNRISEMLQLK
jgi:acetyltransferase-like isoleucine patch superfamily enzyme